MAVVQLRNLRVSSLRSLLRDLRAQLRAVQSTVVAVDPANSDFNPQSLNRVLVTLRDTEAAVHAVVSSLRAEPTIAPFDRPVRRLSAAARRLDEASTELRATVLDTQAGDLGRATSALAQANAALRRAENALNRTQVLLAVICTTGC